MRKAHWMMVMLIGSLCAFASAQSTTQPTSQPSRQFGGGQGGARGDMFIQRIRDQMSDLNLTDDQNKKLDDIFAKAKDDMHDIASHFADMQPAERQGKIRDFMNGVRDKIKDVLTPEQAQKFQEKVEQMRQQRQGGFNRQNGATTQPANAQSGGQGAGQGNGGQGNGQRIDAMVQRLSDSLAALNLSADQKSQTNKIVDQAKSQLTDLRAKARTDNASPDEVRSQVQDVLSNTRDQLAGVLTKDQQEQLRDEIDKRVNQASPQSNPATQPATRPVAMTDEKMQQQEKMQAMADKQDVDGHAATSDDKSKNSQATPSAFLTTTGPKVGDPGPAFNLNKIDGRRVQLSFYRNRPLVIEFGSYSSPTFREHAAQMEDLNKQYGSRAGFLIIYTKEAHPQGGWEVDRNHDDRISIAEAKDMPTRLNNAKDAHTALKITIPMAVDTMNNATATSFSAGENSAIVIGKDGKIAAREDWCDPYRLRITLDQVLANNSVALTH